MEVVESTVGSPHLSKRQIFLAFSALIPAFSIMCTLLGWFSLPLRVFQVQPHLNPTSEHIFGSLELIF